MNKGAGNEKVFPIMFDQRLKDIDISTWFSEAADMSRLRTYGILKYRFSYETYLNENLISTCMYKQMLIQFRGDLLDFRTNTSRVECILFMKKLAKYVILLLKQNFIFS